MVLVSVEYCHPDMSTLYHPFETRTGIVHDLLGLHLVKFFWRAETSVGLSFGEKFVGGLNVNVTTF